MESCGVLKACRNRMKAVTGVKHCCITDVHAPENAEKDNYVLYKEIKRPAVDCFQQKQLEYGKAESGCCCQLIDFISSDMFKASAKSLHQEERMQEELEKNEIKSMSEIFTKNGDPIKFIYITAETGSGKSTFCKNLFDCRCRAHSGGHNDELMKMKKFDFMNSQSIEEMHETQYDKTKIVFKLLENDAAKINVIPDGLDGWSFNRETRNDFQAGFPEHNITIVTTSRPGKILYSLRPLKNIETNLYPLTSAKYIQPAFGDFIGKEINLDTAFCSITVDQGMFSSFPPICTNKKNMMNTNLYLSLRSLKTLDEKADNLVIQTDPLYTATYLIQSFTQHILRPHIDTIAEHDSHFLKVTFLNKGIDFIDLPSIFRDKRFTDAIPKYFKTSEIPIICCKFKTLVRNIIFNYNKIVFHLELSLIHQLVAIETAKNSKFCILEFWPYNHW
ncbi:uncharacterized protein LOC132743833 isoform X2 [Ruditapes philippinarum]|uniref:uncharacterized protein LOC132743833 isoform X2 n=1 Tax=Ruditapes philippinarum TaxID=129788 RepID=UPI00295AD623|nr:uncharacterized protein LOC132743833 isoform X2 [Ruditapes philippinarum]